MLNLGCLECNDHMHSCGTTGTSDGENGEILTPSCGRDVDGIL